MKKLIASLLLGFALVTPAWAQEDVVVKALGDITSKYGLELPAELMTPGQMEVLNDFELDSQVVGEIAVSLLQSRLSGEGQTEALLPQVLSLVNDGQREKLTLSREQTRFAFGLLQLLNSK